jgi:hypothetical protein
MDLKNYLKMKDNKTPVYQLPPEKRPEPEQQIPSNMVDLAAFQNLDQNKLKQVENAFNNQPSLYEKVKKLLGK